MFLMLLLNFVIIFITLFIFYVGIFILFTLNLLILLFLQGCPVACISHEADHTDCKTHDRTQVVVSKF